MKNIVPTTTIFNITRKRTAYFALLCLGCSFALAAQSQADMKLTQADHYYAVGDYLTAAGLYEQYLHPDKNIKTGTGFPLNSHRNTEGVLPKGLTEADIIYKQAESYRLANYWNEAAGKYLQYIQSEGKKYPEAVYWYAVCQRSLGQYTGAMNSINSFLTTNSATNAWYATAQKEMETLLFIQRQLSRPDTGMFHLEKIHTNGLQQSIYAMVPDGNMFIVTGNDTISTTVVKEPGEKGLSSLFSLVKKEPVLLPANPNYNRLFAATISASGVQEISPLQIEKLDTLQSQVAAALSADGKKLYFTQWSKQNGRAHTSIWFAAKTDNGWGQPVLLKSIQVDGYNNKQPFCTSDGRYLLFASDRPGGMGKFDIWYAPILPDGSCGNAVNAGKSINTEGEDVSPFYHQQSNTLVFASDSRPGMGGFDLFAAKGNIGQWQTAENMGYPVNSARNDIYFYASEKAALLDKALVSTDRAATCCLETITVSKQAKTKWVAGYIVDCRNQQVIDGASLVVQDAGDHALQLQSNAQGRYSYALTGDENNQQLQVSRDKYNDKTTNIAIEHINSSQWQTDTLYAATVCLEQKLVIKAENVVSIYFDFDQSNIKDAGKAKLDSIYNELATDTTIRIQISGYTDGRGSEAYNKILSDKRARSCADYLIEKGISENRISFESFGACCPVEMEIINGRDNPDGRSRNRRAMINIDRQ